jgi:hypothetical protein
MMILRGPVKVDLIFPSERHEHEPPWKPAAENLEALDAHFWDWMLWLWSKHTSGKSDLVANELRKLRDHLLDPLGVERPPSSIPAAIAAYRGARDRAEQQFGFGVSRELETEVMKGLQMQKT